MLTQDTSPVTSPGSSTSKAESSGSSGDQRPINLNDPSPSLPLICRRPVRILMFSFLAAFFLWMLGWGLLPRWLDPTFEQHLKDKNVMVGMTREQVMDSWGSPYQMNVSYTDKGIRREEWIYEDWLDASTIKHRYLYFEEGKLVGGWY